MPNFFVTPIGKMFLQLMFQWLLDWLENAPKDKAEAVGTNAGAFAKRFIAEYEALHEDTDSLYRTT